MSDPINTAIQEAGKVLAQPAQTFTEAVCRNDGLVACIALVGTLVAAGAGIVGVSYACTPAEPGEPWKLLP